jgi:hypothetical protein
MNAQQSRGEEPALRQRDPRPLGEMRDSVRREEGKEKGDTERCKSERCGVTREKLC